MAESNTLHKGPIAWMAKNAVASNLLMLGILLSGVFLGMCQVKQEVFPEFDLDIISIQVPYPGAGPNEVEQGIVLAVEESVRGIDGVKKVSSSAGEGVGSVQVEIQIEAEPNRVLADIKNAVDRINSFPENSEEPQVSLLKRKAVVVSMIISGDHELKTLHEVAEMARAELMALKDVTYATITGVPPLEVSVEVSRETLQRYGLTLEEVAGRIRQASLELPAGGLKTDSGELLVRVEDRRKFGFEYENIVVRSNSNGGEVRLSDVASVVDAYEQNDQANYFNGNPAVRLTLYRVGSETPQRVSDALHTYMASFQHRVPEGVELTVWDDDSEMLKSRIGLLKKNALQGFILVLLVLYLFLNSRLAFWVAVGVPISFMGAFSLLPTLDVSVNMISLFAFIITLGMVVDDAIIIGENAYQKTQEGMNALDGAIAGAKEMAMPVTFAILTTIAAFSPMFFVPGAAGNFFRIMPAVVLAVLLFSLIESFFVLPAHLGHQSKLSAKIGPLFSWVNIPSRFVGRQLQRFSRGVYQPMLRVSLRYRYIALASALSLFVASCGMQLSGQLPFEPFPRLEGNLVTAAVRLPYGAPVEQGERIRKLLEQSARDALTELDKPEILNGIYGKVGEGPRVAGGPTGGSAATGSHLVTVEVELVASEERSISAEEVSRAWERLTPVLPGAEALTFNSNIGPGGDAAVQVQLAHRDQKVLAQASQELADHLRGYSILTGVSNSYAAGKPQVDYRMKAEANTYGLTANDLARQLRSFFFGAEALREQRGRNEIRVRVRLPDAERNSQYDLESLRIRTPSGGFVPLAQVAEMEWQRAPTAIEREAGKRVVDVKALLVPGAESVQPVKDDLTDEAKGAFASMRAKYPGLDMKFAGSQAELMESFIVLLLFYGVALVVIYGLLAIPFRSYVQPVIVMVAIPLGFVGAVIGHLVFGYSLSMVSYFGIVALSGVVVNDSLVLIDAANRKRRAGFNAWDSIVYGGVRRLRPILLTSLTTSFGLLPLIFERSVQARFLIPMALSLAFGILFATFVILLVVPATYLIVEDLRGWFAWLVGGDETPPDDEQATRPDDEQATIVPVQRV